MSTYLVRVPDSGLGVEGGSGRGTALAAIVSKPRIGRCGGISEVAASVLVASEVGTWTVEEVEEQGWVRWWMEERLRSSSGKGGPSRRC